MFSPWLGMNLSYWTELVVQLEKINFCHRTRKINFWFVTDSSIIDTSIDLIKNIDRRPTVFREFTSKFSCTKITFTCYCLQWINCRANDQERSLVSFNKKFNRNRKAKHDSCLMFSRFDVVQTTRICWALREQVFWAARRMLRENQSYTESHVS